MDGQEVATATGSPRHLDGSPPALAMGGLSAEDSEADNKCTLNVKERFSRASGGVTSEGPEIAARRTTHAWAGR